MMKCWNKIPVFLFALIIVLLGFSSPWTCYAEDLREILKKAQVGGTYVSPGKAELLKAEELFTRILAGESGEFLQKEWAALNFELHKIREENKNFLILSEIRSHKTGRGFYLFPIVFPDDPVLLQMPHSFKDLYTGNIGLKLALEGDFTGVAWNTVPRYYAENGRRVQADLSDLFDTYFAALTRAFVNHYKDGYVIQLHGYAQEKRRTRTGVESDLIISTGTELPDLWLQDMDTCLERKFSIIVSTYPLEIQELGATKTSIGIILRQMNHKRFLHVEMSKPMRIMMQNNPASRRKFLMCLQETLFLP